jgi:hypothetical protein
MQGHANVRGSLDLCNGRVQYVSFSIDKFDDFTSLLRQYIAQWGQPKTSVVTVEVADASRSIDMLTFQWAAHRYELTFNARLADGLTGNQSPGFGLKCP